MTLELMEKIYVFCHIWAFGGPMIIDKQTDFRKRFSDDFKQTFPTVLYPPEGDVFDYYFDSQTDQHVHWRDFVGEIRARSDWEWSGRDGLHGAQRRDRRQQTYQVPH